MLSKSPKMWQLPQDPVPLPDVSVALYRNSRPSCTVAGSGLNRSTVLITNLKSVLITVSLCP